MFCGVLPLAAGDAGVFLRRRCLRFLRCLRFAADARFFAAFCEFFFLRFSAGGRLFFSRSLRWRFGRAFCTFCGFAFCGGRAVFHN